MFQRKLRVQKIAFLFLRTSVKKEYWEELLKVYLR
jgi:hypothetical protein